jgi:hypothetical protein
VFGAKLLILQRFTFRKEKKQLTADQATGDDSIFFVGHREESPKNLPGISGDSDSEGTNEGKEFTDSSLLQ